MATETNTNSGNTANAGAGTEAAETNEAGTLAAETEGKGKVLTQADIDSAVTARLAREQKKYETLLATEKAKWESEKDLSEFERVKAENARLKEAENGRTLVSSLDAAFEKAGVTDAKTRSLLVGNYKSEAKANEKGEYENLLDVVKTAKEDYPDFFVKKAKGSADASARGGNVSTDEDEFNQNIRNALGY